MGALTEVEIFDCFFTNCRLAAEHCDTLAKSPKKGPAYRALRDCLKLIEGSARQAAHWRGDTRWLPVGLKAEQAHKLAGEWLRGIKHPNGVRVPLAPGHIHPMFTALAQFLRFYADMGDKLKTQRTGRVGLILPTTPRDEREYRPIHIVVPEALRVSRGGILYPSSAGLQ